VAPVENDQEVAKTRAPGDHEVAACDLRFPDLDLGRGRQRRQARQRQDAQHGTQQEAHRTTLSRHGTSGDASVILHGSAARRTRKRRAANALLNAQSPTTSRRPFTRHARVADICALSWRSANARSCPFGRVLSEALPHMQRYDDEIVVVKYGGHAMGDEATARNFARDIVLLEQTAINPVVVHGGGPQIGAMLEKLGIKSVFKDGLRVTDAATVEIVEMVLAGSINKQIVGFINEAGGAPSAFPARTATW
jgi:hypothetical protein